MSILRRVPFVTRFAPSPTGLLHLGHAHAALRSWRLARQSGGRHLLRIEDIDPQRCRPEYTDAVFEDLAWLGIDWDGAIRVQSAHRSEYQTLLDRLAARALIYPCFCTRSDIAREIAAAAAAPHAPDGGAVYPGTCRALTAAERAARRAAKQPYAWRLHMTQAIDAHPEPISFFERGEGMVRCDPARFGDVVLGRKDTPSSYHLCVTHDDALAGVTLVTRGVDLRPATDLHRLLQVIMGWPAPEYAHHALLCDAQGRRLAKRDHAATLRDLRRAGVSPAAVRALAGFADDAVAESI